MVVGDGGLGQYGYTVIQFTRARALGDSDTLELGTESIMPSLQFLYSATGDTLVYAIAPLRGNLLTPARPNNSEIRITFQNESVVEYVSF